MTNFYGSPIARRFLRLGRVLLMLFAGLWLLFIIATRWAEGFSAEGLSTLFTRGGGIIVLIIVAWRWPLIGGLLLFLVGLLFFSGLMPFASGASIATRLILAGPPLILGGLFVAASLFARSRTSGSG